MDPALGVDLRDAAEGIDRMAKELDEPLATLARAQASQLRLLAEIVGQLRDVKARVSELHG